MCRYLRQVKDETIRLSTLAPWAARYAAQEVGVVGYKIPRGTPMIHALGVGLKNQAIWGDTVDKSVPYCLNVASEYQKISVINCVTIHLEMIAVGLIYGLN